MKELMEIKIPVPSLERQKEIVRYCEYNDTLIQLLEKEIENRKSLSERSNNTFLTHFTYNEVKLKELLNA